MAVMHYPCNWKIEVVIVAIPLRSSESVSVLVGKFASLVPNEGEASSTSTQPGRAAEGSPGWIA